MSLTKYRDGFSDTGRMAASYLDTVGPGYQTKHTADSLVRINGDLINVFQDAIDVTPVYAVGRTAAGVAQVRGAVDGSGRFGFVGAPRDGISVPANFNVYGRGLGLSLQLYAATPATIGDAQGSTWEQGTWEVARSRNGVDPTPFYAVDSISPNFAIGVTQFNIEAIPHGYRSVGGKPKFYAGTIATRMVGGAGGQAAHSVIVDDGTNQVYGAALGYSNAIAWFSTSTTLAPGVLLKVDRYLRGTGYTVTPPLVLTYSLDGGLTWAACPTPTLISAELASVAALTSSAPDVAKFTQAVGATRISTAPLSRNTSVVVAVVPYIDTGAVKARVKMGTIDVATMVMSGATVLYDDPTPANAFNFFKDLMATKDGVLVFTRPQTPDHDVWSRPAKIQLTTDGATLASIGFMPDTEANTAERVRALNKTVLACPAYRDGKYILLQSRDGGATWSTRAVISEDGIAPAGGTNLADFGEVAMPRYVGAPANAFPATPWLTDIRIDAP